MNTYRSERPGRAGCVPGKLIVSGDLTPAVSSTEGEGRAVLHQADSVAVELLLMQPFVALRRLFDEGGELGTLGEGEGRGGLAGMSGNPRPVG